MSSQTSDQLIMQWSKAAQDLKLLKKKEADLRKNVIGQAFPDPKLGVNSHDLGAGYLLKFTTGETTTVDPSAYALVQPDLPEHVKEVIKWKPSLDKKAYDLLSEEDRALLDEALVTKPSSPTLALVAPKETK